MRIKRKSRYYRMLINISESSSFGCDYISYFPEVKEAEALLCVMGGAVGFLKVNRCSIRHVLSPLPGRPVTFPDRGVSTTLGPRVRRTRTESPADPDWTCSKNRKYTSVASSPSGFRLRDRRGDTACPDGYVQRSGWTCN